jgi:predicted dehydrogenase
MERQEELATRRGILRQAISTGVVLAGSRAIGANDRVRIGVLGAGSRATQLVSHLLPDSQQPFAGIPQFRTKLISGAEIVAVADVYEPNRERAARAGSTVAKFSDYRKLLDQKDIDAVIIGAPDHWHSRMLIDAVNAGKDAYVEKPVTHSILEGPDEISAVDKTGRIVQTGTQHRSWKHYIQGKEIIDSGALGDVRLVESYWFLNYKPGMEAFRRMSFDSSTLDWKSWLGSAPDQPFSAIKFRFWRYFWDFGGGSLTDLMTHAIDTVQWYMNSPTPSSAIATGRVYDYQFECPDTVSCTLEYPKGFLATYTGNHATGMDFGSIIFRGSKATLEISRAALAVYDEELSRPFAGYDSETRRWRPKPRIYVESDYEGTADNLNNWLDAIRSRKTPNVNIRIGVEAARAAHLGNAALRAGKRATWDEQQQRIVV